MSREKRILVRDFVALGREFEREADGIARRTIHKSVNYSDALVLGALDVHVGGVARPADLVFPLLTTRSGVTGSLNRLEQAGLVLRGRSSDDRRAVFVSLTPDGRKGVRSATRAYDRWVDEIASRLSSSELQVLRRILDRETLGDKVADHDTGAND